jgi:hypothetical protein
LAFFRITWSTLLGFCVPSDVCVRRSWISQVRHATRMSCGRIRLRGPGTGAIAARKPWDVDPHALSAAHLRDFASHPRVEGFCVVPLPGPLRPIRRVLAAYQPIICSVYTVLPPPTPPHPTHPPTTTTSRVPRSVDQSCSSLAPRRCSLSALDRQSSFGRFQVQAAQSALDCAAGVLQLCESHHHASSLRHLALLDLATQQRLRDAALVLKQRIGQVMRYFFCFFWGGGRPLAFFANMKSTWVLEAPGRANRCGCSVVLSGSLVVAISQIEAQRTGAAPD